MDGIRDGLHWHALPAAAALDALRSAPAGLNADEAARRLAAHGPNRLTPPKKRGPLLRFLLQFHNVLIYGTRRLATMAEMSS